MRAFGALLGSSLLAIASSAQAQAIDAHSDDPSQIAGDETSPEIEAGKDGVGAIVVTANRREERLQDVPVSVTLVDGDQLTRQNVNAVEDLTRSAPALSNAGPPGFGALSIRGIGGLSFSRSSEGSVGVVVDGVQRLPVWVGAHLRLARARVCMRPDQPTVGA